MNPNLAVIFDEAEFPEAIHEKTHSGPGWAVCGTLLILEESAVTNLTTA